MNLLTKQKETHRLREGTSGCLYTLLYLKWITNKDLLYSHGTLLNVMLQPGWEGSLRENHICICMTEPFAVHLKLSKHCLLLSYTTKQNLKTKFLKDTTWSLF